MSEATEMRDRLKPMETIVCRTQPFNGNFWDSRIWTT